MKVLRISLVVLIIGFFLLTEARSTDVRIPSQPVVVNSHHSFPETINKLKAAIKKRNLMIIFELKHKEVMDMTGFKGKKMVTVGFVGREMEYDVLRAEPRAALEMPLKIAIVELDNGTVDVIYYQASYLFKHYPNKDLDKLKRGIDVLFGSIIKEAAGSN
jgi:uncharacterized protein (DUF302 family)